MHDHGLGLLCNHIVVVWFVAHQFSAGNDFVELYK